MMAELIWMKDCLDLFILGRRESKVKRKNLYSFYEILVKFIDRQSFPDI